MSLRGKANLIDLTVRRQRRAARSTFSAELHGLVDSTEQMLLPLVTLHQSDCGIEQSPGDMIDSLENGGSHPKLHIDVDARAVCDAVAAVDAREPQGSSLKFHIISVRDGLAQGIIRRTHWVNTRDLLAGRVTKGGVDRTLLRNGSNGCIFKLAHEPLSHSKRHAGSTFKQAEVAAAQPQ